MVECIDFLFDTSTMFPRAPYSLKHSLKKLLCTDKYYNLGELRLSFLDGSKFDYFCQHSSSPLFRDGASKNRRRSMVDWLPLALYQHSESVKT